MMTQEKENDTKTFHAGINFLFVAARRQEFGLESISFLPSSFFLSPVFADDRRM